MKRIFLAFWILGLGVSFSLPVLAQNPESGFRICANPILSDTEGREGNTREQGRKDEGSSWCLPDTIVTAKVGGNYEMYLYRFDDRGNALVTEYFLCQNGQWIPAQRIDAVFNVWDQIDTTVNYFWQGSDYVPAERKISSYDSRGNRILLLNQVWNTASVSWENANRYGYAYTEDGLLEQCIREEYVFSSADSWEETQREDYAYDSDGNEIRYEIYVKNAGSWVPYRTLSRTYEGGLLTLEHAKMINADGIFGDAFKQIYQYDPAGNNIDYLYQTYDSTGWTDAVHRTMKYSDRNLLVEWMSAIWETGRNAWLNQSKEIYTYNEDGSLQSLSVYRWESTQWGQTSRLDYHYDEDGHRTYYVREGIRFDTMQVERYLYQRDEEGNETFGACFRLNREDSVWNPVALYDLALNYADGSISHQALNTPLHSIRIHYAKGTKEPLSNRTVRPRDFSFGLYPNPAREEVHVRMEESGMYRLFLIDPAGKVLQQKTLRGSETVFDMRSRAGLFFLRVEREGAVAVKKVIVL